MDHRPPGWNPGGHGLHSSRTSLMQSTECLIRMTPSSGPEAQRIFFTQVDYFQIVLILPANSLNHRPQNFIREVFFFFSWMLSSAGGVLVPSFLLRSSKITAGGAEPRRALDSFNFAFCLRASDRSGLDREVRRIHLEMIFSLC